MLRENEDEGMRAPGVFCGGSSCRHMFAPSVRGKKSSSHVKQLCWLHIQLLVVLLAGQASCDEPSALPGSLSLATTRAQASEVYYHIDVTVDVTGELKNQSQIKDWLTSVFQNGLNCGNYEETTTTSTSPQTTNGTTPETTSTMSKNESTTTAATSPTSKNESTTTAAMSTSKNESTTTAATSTSKNETTTTAATSPTSKNESTTTAATSPTSKNESTTTAETSATSKNESTTTEPTTQFQTTPGNTGNIKTSKNPNPNQSNNNLRIAHEIQKRSSVKQTREINYKETTGLFQGIDVLCTRKPEIMNCSVTLNLTQSVPTCCILRTLCAASKASPGIHVVGKSAVKANLLQNECSSNPQEEINCTYTGQTGALCDMSATSYSSQCAADKQNNTCNCSASCSGKDAYYSLNMSTHDPKLNESYLISLVNSMKESLKCSPDSGIPCPAPEVVSSLRIFEVACESTATNCKGILGFTQMVPTCGVLNIVMDVFRSVNQVSYTVTQAAYCGHIYNPLIFPSIWKKTKIKPVDFCMQMDSNMLTCQNGEIILVELDDQCVHELSITPGPNATTAQPNTTTLSVNVTTSPLNTTAEALNATTTPANVTLNTPATTESAESQANKLLELTRDVSKLNSSQVDQLVSQLESLLSGPTVSLSLGNISVQMVSNLLGASPEKLSNSSERIIGIVDTVAFKLVLGGKAETLLSPSVALSVKPADGANFQETFFSISNPNNVEVRGDTRPSRSVRKDSSIPQGSIRLPPSLTENLPPEEQQLASRVQFNFYQKSTVFQDRSMGGRRLNSGILGASVANLSISELQDDVVIHLRHIEPVPGNFVTTCVFWDFTKNNGSGGWNSSGCKVKGNTANETICGCNHLTSFAILLDLSRGTITSRVQDTILTFITYIGCGISAIFLSITLLTYLAFGKLRKDIPSKILIQLCLSLLLLNLVFLVDAWLALYPDTVGLCISTAWFLHYFLLVAFTWMGLEAVHMYLALVKVFNSYISRYMLKFSLVGWGIPMIVVIIVIAIDKDNYGLVSYGKFSDGTTDEFCWLTNNTAFYVAVVAYFCVIFLFNFVMFIVVLVQLCRIKRQNPHSMLHRTTLQDARSVAGISILLGLTWGFAFFAWGVVNLPFMYLFAIFNSLQGFFIFVFHCAVKENVRRQWRTYLCCGKMRLAENSEWSRTATQKTVKKSSVTRLTSSKSYKSNNSTSSSTFLVSDSSEQINAIGSPFEDRTITADEDPSMDVILNEINSQYRHQHAS